MLKLSSYFLYTLALLSIVGGLYLTSHSLRPDMMLTVTIITVILFAISGLVVRSIADMKLHIEHQTRYLKHVSKRRKNG